MVTVHIIPALGSNFVLKLRLIPKQSTQTWGVKSRFNLRKAGQRLVCLQHRRHAGTKVKISQNCGKYIQSKIQVKRYSPTQERRARDNKCPGYQFKGDA